MYPLVDKVYVFFSQSPNYEASFCGNGEICFGEGVSS